MILHHHERLVDELEEHGEHVSGGEAPAGADGLRGLEGEAAREDREAPEEDLLVRGEQAIAPVDGGPQRLVARQCAAAAAGEEAEAVVEALLELADGEAADAGGGELDGEGDAVEAAADLQGGREVLLVHLEAGEGRLGALGEEVHGLVALQHGRRIGGLLDERGRGREGERGDAQWGLAGDADGLAAGGEHAHVGAAAEELLGELGAGLHDVLAVVEEKQEALGAEIGGERVEQGAARVLADAEHGRHGLGDAGRIGEGGELDEPHAVGEARQERGADLLGEAALANAAGAEQGEQAGGLEPALDFRGLPGAADEGGQPAGEVVGEGLDGAERRRGGHLLVGRQELPDALGGIEVLEEVRAEVAQRGALGGWICRTLDP